MFDGVGGAIAHEALDLLARKGRMVSFGAASGRWADIAPDTAVKRDVTLLSIPRPTPHESRAFTRRAFAEAVAGRLHPLIGQRFPLEQAAYAHAAIESRVTVGKTLLEVGGHSSLTVPSTSLS